jgi:acyl carrier protein
MNEAQIRIGVIATIREVAPEVESDQLNSARALRQQVDLDSMDWLNVIIGWHRRFGIETPEVDYARLTSVDAVVAYVGQRMGAERGSAA